MAPGSHDVDRLLDVFELTEYEATALAELFGLGRTTAPDLAGATGIPKARVYEVLESLAADGFIEIIPERPKQYQPKAPAAVLERAVENERQSLRQYEHRVDGVREAFLAAFGPRYEAATESITPTESLFHVVDVGEASERETRALYDAATERVDVFTKSFEYFDRVEPAVADAVDRGVAVRVLVLHPDRLSAANRAVQAEILRTIRGAYPAIDVRCSREPLPLRGTLSDPSMDYETGTAVFQVEERDVPLHVRQAAVTESGSLVAAMERYFELAWTHEGEPIEA